MSENFLNFVRFNREQSDKKRLQKEWRNQSPHDFCNDYSKKNNACKLCASVFNNCSGARLVRCNWVPKKINIKLAQQNLF